MHFFYILELSGIWRIKRPTKQRSNYALDVRKKLRESSFFPFCFFFLEISGPDPVRVLMGQTLESKGEG